MTVIEYDEDETSVDLFDAEALADLSDSELLQILVAYQREMHQQLEKVTEFIDMLNGVMEELSSNPMLSMMLPKLG